ncbi:uncharacterized protein LOC131071557 [Cryptomeria japonica]|uniref:uncharacterized protein LOC131071557 n=1 Tax=Cryptomeria japonica TaxID=3369 RepID=UPI0025AD9B4F|nr:uncharacterized protein LOC131071557 [Cryptomeria japonica]
MASSLRAEDRLEGSTNYTSWKVRMMMALNDLAEYVSKDAKEPTDEKEKEEWQKKDFQARRLIIDSVKDHIVSSISKMKSAREMFSTLEKMYEVNNTSRILALRNQLTHIRLEKGESITSYFMRMTDLKDQLSAVEKEVEDNDLTLTTLNGLPPAWEPFIQGISVRIELPKFERLRADCIQEESRLAAKGAIRSSHGGDHHMLAAQSIKKKGGNWKKGNIKRNRDFRPSTSHDSRKKPRDLSRIRM